MKNRHAVIDLKTTVLTSKGTRQFILKPKNE